MIKHLMITACIVLPLTASAAEDKKPTPQQQKMAACNKSAGERKLEGDARKAFMKDCLSADAGAGAHKTTQQEKMSACNKTAGEKALKGDERKKFMSDCLKG